MRAMVRIGSSPPMLLIGQQDGTVECVFVDGNGVIQRRFYDRAQLSPLWLSLSPRSTWPETSQIDVIEIEREEREAKQAKKAKAKAARKTRRSKRIKGRAA